MIVFKKQTPALIIFFMLFAVSTFAESTNPLVLENGLLENIQLLFLVLTGFIFLGQSFNVSRNIRSFIWMGTWGCLSAILREIDVEDLDLPTWIIWIGSGTPRNIFLVAGWGILLTLNIRSFSFLMKNKKQILQSRTAILAYIAVGFLLAGALFDHSIIKSTHEKLWEESLEVTGYLFLLLSSLFVSSILKNRPEKPLLPRHRNPHKSQKDDPSLSS